MNGFNYEDWATATSQGYSDPTEWDGNNRKCNLCDKDAENMDEFCENHQPCIMCNDNEDCGCEDEWSNVSACCEARMDTDQQLCYECKDHCCSVWDEARDNKKNTN
tara:strand:+ start:4563 stop:4880 length:318 start_codon:yes stop_codon:yes gene_type:complete